MSRDHDMAGPRRGPAMFSSAFGPVPTGRRAVALATPAYHSGLRSLAVTSPTSTPISAAARRNPAARLRRRERPPGKATPARRTLTPAGACPCHWNQRAAVAVSQASSASAAHGRVAGRGCRGDVGPEAASRNGDTLTDHRVWVVHQPNHERRPPRSHAIEVGRSADGGGAHHRLVVLRQRRELRRYARIRVHRPPERPSGLGSQQRVLVSGDQQQRRGVRGGSSSWDSSYVNHRLTASCRQPRVDASRAELPPRRRAGTAVRSPPTYSRRGPLLSSASEIMITTMPRPSRRVGACRSRSSVAGRWRT